MKIQTKRLIYATLLISATVAIGIFFSNRANFYINPDKTNVIVIGKTSDTTIEFWSDMINGMTIAAEEFNVDFEYIAPPNEGNIQKQIELLYDAIKKKPDVLVLVAADYYKLREAAKKADDDGIKVITLDSDVDATTIYTDSAGKNISKKFTYSHIATDNIEAGKKAGREIYRIINTNKTIAILSHLQTSTTAIDREAGVVEGFGRNQKERILNTYYCDASEDKAFEIATNIMKKHPDIGGFVGLNEYVTRGIAQAVKASGHKDIEIVGFDASIHQIKLMEEGYIDAVVIQQPFNMGYFAIQAASEVNRNRPINDRIMTNSILISKDTMYNKENQKLLFPFKNGIIPTEILQ